MTLDDRITAILAREGSTFTKDAQDVPTKFGVTLSSYRAWKAGKTEADLEALTLDEARSFYWWYFHPFAGLVLSDRLWSNLLDADTLHGRPATVRMIQGILGVVVDGVLGPKTREALEAVAEGPFVLALAKQRLRLMRNDIVADVTKGYGLAAVNGTDLKYLGGWMERVLDVAFG